MLKQLQKNESGSVMLETVLVLPLHLMLLFGVVWIGTLSFDRLYFSEFSYTMQGADTTTDNLKTLFFGENNSLVSITGKNDSTADGTWWKQTTNGNLKLTQDFPSCLNGLTFLMKEWFKASSSIPAKMEITENGNTSYFRNADYYVEEIKTESGETRKLQRSDIFDATTPAWLNVAKERFPAGEAVDSNISGTAIAEYKRNDAFAEWSKK